MDDTYQINVAKTEFREAYNRGEVDRLLSVFENEGFTDINELTLVPQIRFWKLHFPSPRSLAILASRPVAFPGVGAVAASGVSAVFLNVPGGSGTRISCPASM